MTVSELQEITLIDNDIQSLHQRLHELYERRAEILNPSATDRANKTKRTLNSHMLNSIDLTISDTPRSLILSR